MTRDELKEKVALAIARESVDDLDMFRGINGEDAFQALIKQSHDHAEAALSAIEAAGMAVVPVEPDDERLADLPEHPVEAMHRAWRTTRPSGVCGQTMDAVWRNKYAREMVAYRAMVEAGRVR